MSEPKIHELKILPEFFEDVRAGRKPFELRENDRGFSPGCILWLREWTEAAGYTGRVHVATVTYMLYSSPGLTTHFVILGLAAPMPAQPTDPIVHDRAVRMERDLEWCSALIETLDVDEIAKITSAFNRLRRDP